MPSANLILSRTKLRLILALPVAFLAALPTPVTAQTAAVESDTPNIRYSSTIAPLLRTYCAGCHNRSEAAGKLSVLSPDELFRGGEHGPAIDTAQPASSHLLKVITSTGDDHMPPADEPQPSAAELQILKQWVLSGAKIDSRVAVLPALPSVPSRVNRPATITALDLSPDGSHQLFGRFKVVEVRPTPAADSTASPQPLTAIPVPDGKVTDVHFSRDGSGILIAAGTPGLAGRAFIAHPANGSVVAEFSGTPISSTPSPGRPTNHSSPPPVTIASSVFTKPIPVSSCAK